mmetsp:Transcript_2860/g.7014  ORF Transcript_2860/g.7014 Transcript_2860/m.7014 type:complete len:381 (+) Transcript_2860:121-1263(+)
MSRAMHRPRSPNGPVTTTATSDFADGPVPGPSPSTLKVRHKLQPLPKLPPVRIGRPLQPFPVVWHSRRAQMSCSLAPAAKKFARSVKPKAETNNDNDDDMPEASGTTALISADDDHYPLLLAVVQESTHTLHLKNCDVEDEYIPHLNMYFDPRLHEIDLSFNPFTGPGTAALVTGLLSLRGISSLNLSFTPIGDSGAAALAKLIRQCQKLTNINLRSCGITHVGCDRLTSSMSVSDIVEQVNLSFNKIGVRGGLSFGKHLQTTKTLRILKLECCELSTAGASGVAVALNHCRSVTHIHFAFNEIEDEAGQMFAKTLAHKTCNLRLLDLGNNQFGKGIATVLFDAASKSFCRPELRLLGAKLNAQAWKQVQDRVTSLKSLE